jgi:hypothetical protein
VYSSGEHAREYTPAVDLAKIQPNSLLPPHDGYGAASGVTHSISFKVDKIDRRVKRLDKELQ